MAGDAVAAEPGVQGEQQDPAPAVPEPSAPEDGGHAAAEPQHAEHRAPGPAPASGGSPDKTENLHEYFQDTFQGRLVQQSEEQKYDATMLTPATRLLQKQREMHMVEEDLQRQKLEFQERMEVLGQRKEALRNKEQALADQLLRFDKFLKENDARRNRALKKTCDERELCLQKDEELTHLTSELDELHIIRDEQRDQIKKQDFYEGYLRSVLTSSDEFSEINELIDRYDTLHITNKDLVRIDNECQEQMQTLTTAATRNKENHRIQMLGHNTKLGELSTRKEKAEKETLYWESQAQQAEQNATKRTLLLGRIRMATANLYALVNAHAPGSGSTNAERIPNTGKQLDKIQIFIKDLEDVVKEFEDDNLESGEEGEEQ